MHRCVCGCGAGCGFGMAALLHCCCSLVLNSWVGLHTGLAQHNRQQRPDPVAAADPVPCPPTTPQVITTGALLMELAAVLVLGATFVVYDYYASQDSY